MKIKNRTSLYIAFVAFPDGGNGSLLQDQL
jgi:hypothetical protein